MDESTKIYEILDFGTITDKIKILESSSQSSDQEIINKIITKLDDSEIEVRGEAFSSLLINKNDISKFLINALSSENKNIKAFSALVLANRGDTNSIPLLELLSKDPSSMVRDCALGALEYLRTNKFNKEI
jgi:HEAT repeat protein